MTTPERGLQRHENDAVVKEIKDYENTDIRELLGEVGIVETGDEIMLEDYKAIQGRAVVLREGGREVTARAALIAGFIDRKKHLHQLSDDAIKSMPKEVLGGYIYAETGVNLDDESLEGLRRSDLGLEEWVEKWTALRQNGTKEFSVAVDKGDSVISRGTSPEEALRRAQEEG